MTTTAKRRLTSGLATVALAGALSTGLIAQQARPAEALLPVVPAVVLGGVGAATGISVTGLVTAVGVTAGVVGLAFAIQQPGAFDWMKDIPDWFTGSTDGNGTPVETKKQEQFVPIPSREGDADPLFYDYVWKKSVLSVTDTSLFTNASTGIKSVRFTYYNNSTVSGDQYYGTVWATGTCKHPTDSTQKAVSTGRLIQRGLVQTVNGYRQDFLDVSCANLGLNNTWVPTEVNIQPPTTKQKLTAYTESNSLWPKLAWADAVNVWRSADYAPANPQYRVEVTCKNIDTGSRQVLTSSTDPNAQGAVNVPTCAQLGPKWYPEAMVVGFADGDTLKQPIFTATPAEPEQFFQCDPVFGQACKFEIWVDGKPCVIGSPACASWAGLFKVAPGRVLCMYGGRQVDMSGCAILEGAYIYGGTPAIKPNIDGNPDTWVDPSTVPGWTPHILPSPTPDNPRPVPVPDPNPQPQTPPNPNPAPTEPSTNPNPSPSPSPGTGTDPNAPWNNPAPIPDYGSNPAPQPPQGAPSLDPNVNDTNCWPGGTAAFNPLEWVLQPVKCALSWAFVPRQDVAQQQMTKVETAFGKVPVVASIGTVTTAIGTLGGGAGGGSGCTGPAFNFDFNSVHETIYPFNACAEPVATMARITNALTTVIVIILGVLGIVRAFGASVGFNFTMGKGGDS